jgi:hypothetical protein
VITIAYSGQADEFPNGHPCAMTIFVVKLRTVCLHKSRILVLVSLTPSLSLTFHKNLMPHQTLHKISLGGELGDHIDHAIPNQWR